jgi:hypothetical protein
MQSIDFDEGTRAKMWNIMMTMGVGLKGMAHKKVVESNPLNRGRSLKVGRAFNKLHKHDKGAKFVDQLSNPQSPKSLT